MCGYKQNMNRIACLLFLCAAWCAPTFASAHYTIINGGLSPNKQFSLAVDKRNLYSHVYLLREPRHQKIGPLSEVNSSSEVILLEPDTCRAVWSPNSRYVAVLFRVSLRYENVQIYQITAKRAYLVKGPDINDVLAQKCHVSKYDLYEQRANSFSLVWKSNTRFVLTLAERVKYLSPEQVAALGAFGTPNAEENNPASGKTPKDAGENVSLNISADAACELGRKNTYRITGIKPHREKAGGVLGNL